MSEKISITMNGKKLEVLADQTIFDVAKEQGIEIPTFCYDDRMKPFASCFVCVVEVEKARTLLPACSTKVTPDMVVYTHSEKVMKARKMALDLMLSDHTGDCTAPCVDACPAHADVQGYVAHVANGDHEAAVRLIKKKLPLPIVCGTICPNPCEAQCRRGLVDDPIAIRAVKRFAAEYDLKEGPYLPPVGKDTGKKVDIIGGGPAGLTAAYFLRQQGHEVHIHEALPQLGGMVRYGIPSFRLPWDKLDAEINAITELGVNVHLNSKLGRDFTLEDLKAKGADAVLVAIGAHKSKPMRVENEDVPGVIGGIDFLRKVVLKEEVNAGQKVAVIGGGDVAMDCARVAKRLGADVSLLYRRTQKEMPALQHEQDETIEEGVKFEFLTAPVSVNVKDGKAESLKIVKMELGAPDESGRRRPVPVEGSEQDLKFDLIISAIGQEPDLSCLEGEKQEIEKTRWNTLIYDEKNMTTPIDGIFTAGDCAYGPNTVVRSIGEGRTAAESIGMYLSGAKIEYRNEYSISKGRLEELSRDDFAPRYEQKKRAKETIFPAEKRLANGGYAPINLALNEIESMAESSRCIECGCAERHTCDLKRYASEYNADEKRLAGIKRDYETDTSHPLIKIESNKCITCGSCVRVCDEVREISALSFVKRGFSTHIAPNFEDSLCDTDCDACGMCIDVCPTGTMATNTDKKFGPWPSEVTETTCTSCGRACRVNVQSTENKVMEVRSQKETVMCKEGRFIHHVPNNIEKAGSLEEATKLISDAQKMAVLVSPKLTVEEIFAAHQYAKKIDAGIYYHASKEKIAQPKFPFSKEEGVYNVALLEKLNFEPWLNGKKLDKSDTVLMIGSYSDDLPKNTKVISVSPFSSGKKADVEMLSSSPITTEGAFLTNEGKLSIMESKLDTPNSTLNLLSELSGIAEFKDLTALRKQLVEIVPEFENLLSAKGVVETKLAPSIKLVAKDAKEMAFASWQP